ncbi:MAG: AtpZ/AtpI family protein, partial [Planctomycetales bacterium]
TLGNSPDHYWEFGKKGDFETLTTVEAANRLTAELLRLRHGFSRRASGSRLLERACSASVAVGIGASGTGRASVIVPGAPKDNRPPLAIAMDWVSRVFSVALIMVLPGLGGQWLDKRWGTNFLALAGFALGVAAGIYYLLVVTRIKSNGRPDRDRSTD